LIASCGPRIDANLRHPPIGAAAAESPFGGPRLWYNPGEESTHADPRLDPRFSRDFSDFHQGWIIEIRNESTCSPQDLAIRKA
jgi:hypothetical protein